MEEDVLKALTEALDKFSSSVENDLAEMRKEKDTVLAIKNDILKASESTYMVRDDGTLVLSAPKIIIGNVDAAGNLMSGGEVIVRGTNLSFEATGSPEAGGTITSRAASIRNLAVDPGVDGTENVVCEARSEIVNQANCITLTSSEDKGAFLDTYSGNSGINLLSDTVVNISATPSVESKAAAINDGLEAVKDAITELKSRASSQKTAVKSIIKDLQDCMDSQFEFNDSEFDICFETARMSELQEKYELHSSMLVGAVNNYVNTLSQLASMNSRKNALEKIKTNVSDKKSTFKEASTDSAINLKSETFNMLSTDGDGNIRTNPEAGMNIQMPHIQITANDAKGKLIENSNITVTTQDVNISTVSPELDEKFEKGDITSTGSVTITSKEFVVQSVDKELDNKEQKEKALTAGGKIILRAESISALATDQEGKSTGTLNLDAKKMTIAAMDVDPKTLEAKEMAAESQLNIQAEKTFVGTTEKAKLVQLASEKVGIMAKDTAEMQQDGKAVITLSGGNMDAGGSAVNLAGDTTIKGNADIKGEAKAPKGTFDQVEASQAFKSPNIDDTLGAGAPAPAEQPSAKMQEEKAQ